MTTVNAKAHARAIKLARVKALQEAQIVIRKVIEDYDLPHYKDTLKAQERAIQTLEDK